MTASSSSATLHYIFDPLCGWCYGAEPLVKAAHEAGVNIKVHGGGLWDPEKKIDPSMRDHIRSNDSSISSLTGQKFGQKYFDNIIGNSETVIWSQPTIDAVLAAGKSKDDTPETVLDMQLAMIEAIQASYYVSGRLVTEREILKQIAKEIGLDPELFEKKLNPGAAVKHIKQTRKLMKTWSISGFPNFVLEKSDSTTQKIDHSKFYGKPDKFVKLVNSMM